MKIQVGECRSEGCGEVVCSSYVKGRSGFCRLNMAGWLEVLRRFAYPELQPRPVILIAGLTMVACSNRDVPPARGHAPQPKHEISQFSHPSELHTPTPILAKIISATAINDRLRGIYIINLRNLIKTAQKIYNECSKMDNQKLQMPVTFRRSNSEVELLNSLKHPTCS